jgi:hypothetical protein
MRHIKFTTPLFVQSSYRYLSGKQKKRKKKRGFMGIVAYSIK